MEFRNVIGSVRHQWFLVAGSLLIALLVAVGWILLNTPMYKASAQLFVSSAATSGDRQAGEQFQAAVFAQQRVATYAQLVSSPEVLDPVIKELGLPTTPQDLAEEVTAVNPVQTVLLEVSAADADPAQAAAIANSIAQNLAAAIQNLETTDPKLGSPLKVSIVSPAVAPPDPYSPNKAATLGLALILGLAAGIGAAVLRDRLDTSVKAASDLIQISGSTPLGVVNFDANAEIEPLSALDQQAARSESFRQIRTEPAVRRRW
ncbi:MAG: Wzz/FepE/Etk N-terminal domain-containing protein [Candidatus Nanopelagicales bacterium]